MTACQGLVARGEQFTESADPDTVQLAGYPSPVAANVGPVMRRKVMQGTSYRWIKGGQVVIRKAVLAPFDLPLPASQQEIQVQGKAYRIEFVSEDSTAIIVDFSSVS